MRKTIFRILVFVSVLAIVGFAVVLVNQTAQLVALASTLHPVLGQGLAWALVFLYAACVGVPLVLLVRLPKPLVPPESEDSPEFQDYLRRLGARLRGNPALAGKELTTREQLTEALAVLDGLADAEAKAAASRVFLSTAVSQNGALDSLLVLGIQSRLVWDVARVYNQRPSLRDMAYLYGNVVTTAFVAAEIDEADLAEQIQPVLSSVLGTVAGAVPGLQVMSSVFVNSVFSGTANAFLTLRVGLIAKEYSKATVRPVKGVLRRSAFAGAARMLGSVALAGAAQISGAMVRASGKTVTGAAAGIGKKLKGAGEAMVDSVSFWKKPQEPGRPLPVEPLPEGGSGESGG